MASIVKGVVGYGPKSFTSKKGGHSILKFNVQVDGNKFKKVPVFVIGDLAEKHKDIGEGQEIVVSGDYEETTYNGETTKELKVFFKKGNIKLVGEKIVRVSDDDNAGSGVSLDDPPEIVFYDMSASDDAYGMAGRRCGACGDYSELEIPEDDN